MISRQKWAAGFCTGFLVVTLLVNALWASGSSAASLSETASAPGQVTIGVSGGYVTSYTDIMVAQGAGYLAAVGKKFHTRISYAPYASSNTTESAFLSGTNQFQVSGVPSWGPPVVQGKPALSVLASFVGLALVFVGAEKYQSSRGSNVKAYSDSNWCITGPNSGSSNAQAALAKSAGLNLANLHTISVGGVAAFLPTMQSSQCDITTMDTTHAADAVAEHIGYVVANTNSPAVFEKMAGAQVASQLVTTPAFAKQYPALTQAIVTAELRALKFVVNHAQKPQAIYAKLPIEYTSSNTEAQFVQQFKLGAPSFVFNNGLISASQIHDTLEVSVNAGVFTPATAKMVAKAFTNRFAKVAYKQLGLTAPNS